MRTFVVITEGENRFRLRELFQRYFDDQWVADHFEQATRRSQSSLKIDSSLFLK